MQNEDCLYVWVYTANSNPYILRNLHWTPHVVTPCSMADGYNFGRYPEDGSSMFLQNVSAHLPKHMMSHSIMLYWEPQTATGYVVMWKECQKKEAWRNCLRISQKRSIGKTRKRWLDDTENDVKKMGVTGWRKTARGRDTWKLIMKEAEVSHGAYSRCSRSKVMSNGQDGPWYMVGAVWIFWTPSQKEQLFGTTLMYFCKSGKVHTHTLVYTILPQKEKPNQIIGLLNFSTTVMLFLVLF